jgi:osmotically-inducible protein OsmY
MRWAMLLGLVVLTGCSRTDGQKLARIGQLTADKLRDAAPAQTPFDDLAPATTAAARVRVRQRTDAALAELPIQVHEGPDGIHLKGHVPHPDHAEWAVKLARETLGVVDVVNELTVGP